MYLLPSLRVLTIVPSDLRAFQSCWPMSKDLQQCPAAAAARRAAVLREGRGEPPSRVGCKHARAGPGTHTQLPPAPNTASAHLLQHVDSAQTLWANPGSTLWPNPHRPCASPSQARSPLCAGWRGRHGCLVKLHAWWQHVLLLARVPCVDDARMQLHARHQRKPCCREQLSVLLERHLCSLEQSPDPKQAVIHVLRTEYTADSSRCWSAVVMLWSKGKQAG